MTVRSIYILLLFYVLLLGHQANAATIAVTPFMEICDNGIDDDGDGLIDCFDDDCFATLACEGFYYGASASTCTFEPEIAPAFELEFVCQTNDSLYPIDQRSAVYVGDVDGDGIPEMVANDPSPGRIQIFNGEDCSIKQSIVTENNSPFAQVAIADVDLNGLGDIFLFENGNNLARFECGTDTALWRTVDGIEVNNFSTPHIADFNADGIPEVYAGSKIYDSLTGTRLAVGTGSRGNYNTNSDSKVIAYDVFQAGDPKPGGGVFGAEADGLELIAGNNVYTVELGDGTMDNGTLTVVSEITSNGLTDGFTSIADIDGDCLIDVVVMDAGKIYVWNPRTQTQIGTSYFIPSTSGGGRINIGDFDGDGMVEMGTAGANQYVVIEYDAATNTLVEKWRTTGLDDGSQRTGSSLFDFEGDGMKEVVYSEEGHLFVLNAETGAEIIKIPAEAGTRSEYPLVADVNADGAAEIVLTAQDGNGPGFSGNDYVQVYRSKSFPWVSARPVWNQHGYFNTNINDDLTVPIVQQDMLNKGLGGAFNTFLAQTSILSTGSTPAFAAADATLDILGVGTDNCPTVLEVEMKVENLGDAPIPAGTPIAYYTSNPTTTMATLLGTSTVPNTIDIDSMDTFSFGLDISPLLTPINIYAVVNDTGFVMNSLPYNLEMDFPVTGTAECDFTNNLDSALTIVCIEVCGDNKDNDGDGLADEPNITAPDTKGCSGDMLAQMTTDLVGGTWGIISSIGSTIDAAGNVTLGTNNSSTPDVDTVFYVLAPCNDTILITTVDDVPPSLSCPGNRDVFVDNNCETIAGDYRSSTSATDNCTATSAISISQSPASGTILTVGTTVVTISGTDISGNVGTCTFQVIVEDNTDPQITCPANANVVVDNSCDFVLPDYTNDATVTDNCTAANAITFSQFPTVGTTINGGGFTQLIAITAMDASGNSEQCFFQITLNDTTAPNLSCPFNQVETVEENCRISVPDYRSMATISDNCTSLGDLIVTQTPSVGTILSGDGTVQLITITATDENSNSSQCTFQINLEDTSPPSVTCPANQNIIADATCTATIPDYTGDALVSDNCTASTSITLNQSPSAGTTLSSVGTQQTITIIANDGNGNTMACSFMITVVDTTRPSILCAANDTLMVNTLCQASIPDFTLTTTVMDNCSAVADIISTQNPVAGITISGHGTVQDVILTAADESGNLSRCTTSIYLRDTLPPTLICPSDQLISVDPMCQVSLADYTGVVAVDDNCTADAGITLSQNPPPTTTLMGDGTMQVVTITGEDGNGNTSQCQFTIELEDGIDPSITCPSDQSLPIDVNCEATIPDYTDAAIVTSRCFPATDFTVTQVPVIGTLLSGIGSMQTITLTADNGAGKSNSCSFDITLTDTLAPVINCPLDVTLSANANCEVILPNYTEAATASDNCSTSNNITITQSPGPATILSGGMTHTIVITATDESGNTTQCTFEVMIQDSAPPSLNCPSDVTVFVNEDCEVLLPNYTTAATVSDDCTVASSITITQNPKPGIILSGAVTTQIITLTADDGSATTSCDFSILLVDTLVPTIICPVNQNILMDENCLGAVPNYTDAIVTSDNCTTPNNLLTTQTPTAGTVFTGANTIHTITLTTEDESGNSESCTFQIQLKDELPPLLVCPDNQMSLVNGCEYVLPDFFTDLSVSDNCSNNAAITILQNPPPSTIIEDTGVHEIILTAIDENGNSSQCSFFIELDISFPVLPTVFGN